MVLYKNFIYAGGLAEIYHDRKQYEEADRYYRLANQTFPNESRNYVNPEALLPHLKKPKEVLIHLEKAKTLKMSDNRKVQLCNNIGMAYFQLGRPVEAI